MDSKNTKVKINTKSTPIGESLKNIETVVEVSGKKNDKKQTKTKTTETAEPEQLQTAEPVQLQTAEPVVQVQKGGKKQVKKDSQELKKTESPIVVPTVVAAESKPTKKTEVPVVSTIALESKSTKKSVQKVASSKLNSTAEPVVHKTESPIVVQSKQDKQKEVKLETKLVIDEEDEEQQSESKLRYFKLIYNNSL